MQPSTRPPKPRPAPPLPDQPAEWAWPDPPGGPHFCDREALDAIERAEIFLRHGDRRGCMMALCDYELLRDCGVERPDFESRVRGMFARLGGLPPGYRVPESVATLEELLAVFAFNQDSPQKTFCLGGGWHYVEAQKKGQKEGHVRAEWRFYALVNCGRPRHPSDVKPGDHRFSAAAEAVLGIDDARVAWDGGEFDRSPADRNGQPTTPEHHLALAEVARRKWAAVLAFAERAEVYGWTLDRPEEYRDAIGRICERAGVPLLPLPPPPEDLFTRRGRKG